MVIASALGSLLVILGIVLAFRAEPWKGQASGQHDKTRVSLPAPLASIVLGIVLLGGSVWWLWRTFPAESISFSQKAWTLKEVKERLERVSRIRVELRGAAESFALDKQFSGACAADVLSSICSFYSPKLQCEHDSDFANFVITARP